jgi:hypothetical protein
MSSCSVRNSSINSSTGISSSGSSRSSNNSNNIVAYLLKTRTVKPACFQK